MLAVSVASRLNYDSLDVNSLDRDRLDFDKFWDSLIQFQWVKWFGYVGVYT